MHSMSGYAGTRFIRGLKLGVQVEELFTAARLSVAYCYDVILHTGNRFGAGTDANVFLTLYGEKGNSDEFKLPTKKGDLERGMVNKYKITAPDLGSIKNLNIRHDNQGIAPAWFLEKVTIKDHSGSRYIFQHGDWLLKRVGEDKLKAQLNLSEQNIDQLSTHKGIKINYSKVTSEEHLTAVQDTVHENLTQVLHGIIRSETNSDFNETQSHMPNQGTGFDGNAAESSNQSHVPMLPSARLLVQAFDLAVDKIPLTGPKGHLLKGDVLKYIEDNKITRSMPSKTQTKIAAAATKEQQLKQTQKQTDVVKKQVKKETKVSTTETGNFEDIKLTEEFLTDAEKYLISKTEIPHVYSSFEVNIDRLLKIQKDLSQHGVPVSMDAFLIKAAAHAIAEVPEMNVHFIDDVACTLDRIDIAVTLFTNKGTFKPVIEGVRDMRLQEVADNLKNLEQLAETSMLEVNRSASFTISYLGDRGISHVSEIITPPQVCIMSVGEPQIVIKDENDFSKCMNVSLSYDGRIISEHTSSKFITAFKDYIGNPLLHPS